jgi:hypothetical protein
MSVAIQDNLPKDPEPDPEPEKIEEAGHEVAVAA